MFRRVVSLKLTDVIEVLTASVSRIILIMETLSTPDTSDNRDYTAQHPKGVIFKLAAVRASYVLTTICDFHTHKRKSNSTCYL
jgi:hypothetical protein